MPPAMQAVLKVRVLRAFYYERELQKVDKVITLPRTFAAEVVASNKGAFVYDEPAPAKEKKEAKNEPLSHSHTAAQESLKV